MTNNKTKKATKTNTNSKNHNKTKKTKKKTNNKTKKDRKWTDPSYPYRIIRKQQAIDEFLKLKQMAQGDINPKSIMGNRTVDWGTEKMRKKTKYRNHAPVDLWKNKEKRAKLLEFAKRLAIEGNIPVEQSVRKAIDLQWGTVNTMRPASAVQMYKKYNATSVLDFTAGWGARMIAAMALDIDYIGIDSNKSLKSGYEKIINLLKPYTKSKVTMVWKEAQTVDISKLPKYDYVFTSPPYEYLEVYEHMSNYENKSVQIRQPYSSQNIKHDDSTKFYDEFIVPTLKSAYKHLPKNRYICINMPDMMYEKIKKRWKPSTHNEEYKLVKRPGSNWKKTQRRGKEVIYCWKK
jgi:16S rRNA G966 N2-methylase RsmD